MTITIKTEQPGFLKALTAFCTAMGVTTLVVDNEKMEDDALFAAMQEVDVNDKIPVDDFLDQLNQRIAALKK